MFYFYISLQEIKFYLFFRINRQGVVGVEAFPERRVSVQADSECTELPPEEIGVPRPYREQEQAVAERIWEAYLLGRERSISTIPDSQAEGTRKQLTSQPRRYQRTRKKEEINSVTLSSSRQRN